MGICAPVPSGMSRSVGRPSLYSAEVAEAICTELAEGRSLRSVCKSERMPCRATVFGWLKLHSEFLDQYGMAKAFGVDVLAGDILDIADGNGHVARDRLRINARKWYASKIVPRKYGRTTAPTRARVGCF
jgi:hypothetical protein